jgi:protein-S-isoprenylcysteine O-methyltransferase Ste14
MTDTQSTTGADAPGAAKPDENKTAEPAADSSGPLPEWTFREARGIIKLPAIYRMILFIYVPFLIPIGIAMTYFGRWVDGLLGWGPLPGFPFNLIVFVVLTSLGLIIIWWCYSYLIIVGGGGPAPLVAKGAVRLVLVGPYGLTRHPSVVGKFLGILGLGFLMRTPFFCFVFLPVVLTVSLIEKRFFMERRDIKSFGKEYADYVASVPFFIPRLSDIWKLIAGEKR